MLSLTFCTYLLADWERFTARKGTKGHSVRSHNWSRNRRSPEGFLRIRHYCDILFPRLLRYPMSLEASGEKSRLRAHSLPSSFSLQAAPRQLSAQDADYSV